MARVSVLIALAFLTAALAGCTSPPPAPVEQAEQSPEEGARLLSPQEIANASQQEQQDNAQGEFARTLEERFHTHNYWGGGLEKLLMDEDIASAPMTPLNPNDPAGSAQRIAFGRGFFGGFGFNNGFTPFEMPEGSIIPPETERVEVSVSWTSSNTITGLWLGYRSAMNKDFEATEPFPAGGGTATIATNLSMNDMPHTTVSKWRFFLAPDNPNGGPGVFNGTAHVVIKAFRNETLFLAPPHPDYWQDNTTLELAQFNGTMQCTRVVFPLFLGPDGAGCENGFAFLELPNGTIVPPHTGLLTLELTWANTPTAPDPFTSRPDLLYTPANTRRFLRPENAVVEQGRAVYTLAVDPKMVDSPYANVSEWTFVLVLTSSGPSEQQFGFGGIGDFRGDYALSIRAEREQVQG